jgi:diacylglycerol O-acyltransferase / trehalose O-mycolyltransferase
VTASVKTAALPGPANVRILMPSGYRAHPGRRYPVLYLIHGTSGGAPDWTEAGDAQKTTAGKPLIVVMPDIGLNYDGGGWCSNWPGGPYAWETFHIDQLVPWIDRNLPTIATRRGRAVAGLSQGGFCSTSYAARHPDLFSAAFSYSGAPDIAYDLPAQVGSTGIINATEVFLDRVAPNSIFGDRVTNEVNWAAHDPATLAENLRATRLYLYTGNGQPGPLDSVGPVDIPGYLPSGGIEALVHQDTIYFHNRLEALGIPSYFNDYGPGTHTWGYWARDLRWSMPQLMHDFKHPARRPRRITYTSADDSYAVYGWSVHTHRDAREFSTLARAGCRGFTLSGSGSASVRTPACLAPDARYRVGLAGDNVDSKLNARASRNGRLRIDVPLGPSNPYQQYTAAADVAGTAVYNTRVTIRRARRAK